MNYFAEYAPEVKIRTGNMIPVADLRGKFGFRSVYLFNEKDASAIRKNGHSRGFGQFNVSSDRLFIDLDGAPVPEHYLADLDARGIAWGLYESGHKGHHIEIPTEFTTSDKLPAVHASYMKWLGFEHDGSIYRADMLIRLNGTTHQTTGKIKKRIRMGTGKCVLPYAEMLAHYRVEESAELDIPVTRLTFLRVLKSLEVAPVSRHNTLWSLAENFKDCGFSEATSIELCETVNKTFPLPTTDDEVRRAVRDAYRGS